MESLASRGILALCAKAITEEQEWSSRVEKTHHHLAQFVVLDRLGHIVVESCTSRILNLVSHGVCGESHDRNLWVVVPLLPVTNVFAGFISILDRHLDVTLQIELVSFVKKR